MSQTGLNLYIVLRLPKGSEKRKNFNAYCFTKNTFCSHLLWHIEGNILK